MFYPQEVIEEVRIQNDIVHTIGTYVRLKQRGTSFVGLCPFHNESTPSFSVSVEKQMYHCFGCGESGNIYTFVMRIENIDFSEAVKQLADRARITLPAPVLSAEAKRKNEIRQQLFAINKQAARFFYSALISTAGEATRQYLQQRGISEQMVKHFGLGTSADLGTRTPLYDFLRAKGYSDELLEKSGLLYKSKKSSGFFDRYYNRLMFPIFNVAGEVVGFGGRILGEGEPKYLNSPETELFNKSKCLYGLNFAKTNRKSIVIVEGYLDVIALHQAGFTNAVAALGTAFGMDHAHILRKYTDQIILLFDSDKAGETACLRAIQILVSVGFRPSVVQVQGAKDPDEFLKKNGADAFARLLENAINYITFQINCIRKNKNMQNTEDVIDFTKGAAHILATIENPVEREAYLNEVAKTSHIPYEAIKAEVDKKNESAQKLPDQPLERKYMYKETRKKQEVGREALLKAQQQLIRILIEHFSVYAKVRSFLQPEDFPDPVCEKLAAYIYRQHEKEQPIFAAEVIGHFETAEEQRAVGEIFAIEAQQTNLAKNVNDQVRLIKIAGIEKREQESVDIATTQALIQEKRNVAKLYVGIGKEGHLEAD